MPNQAVNSNTMRAIGNGGPRRPRRRPSVDGHPQWCARAHHCTALRTVTGGEHASIPEIWETRHGRLIATRYRDQYGNDRLEIRSITALSIDDDTAEEQAQHLIAHTYAALDAVYGKAQIQEAAKASAIAKGHCR